MDMKYLARRAASGGVIRSVYLFTNEESRGSSFKLRGAELKGLRVRFGDAGYFCFESLRCLFQNNDS